MNNGKESPQFSLLFLINHNLRSVSSVSEVITTLLIHHLIDKKCSLHKVTQSELLELLLNLLTFKLKTQYKVEDERSLQVNS